MKILICRGNFDTPKSYPYWEELLNLLKDNEIKEIRGILSENEIIDLVNWSDVWITIDSFLPHLCAFKKLKPGIVIWGVSDPEIFGYPHNTNILRSRSYLRPNQFLFWTGVPINKDAFVVPSGVVKLLKDNFGDSKVS
jgi:hypothetical protein